MSGLQDQIRDASARNSELLATLSRTDHAIPSVKQQNAQIREIEAEERRNDDRLKRLSNSREKELKDHKKYNESVMKRFAYKATGQKEKFASKADKEEREYFEALRGEHRAREEQEQLKEQLEAARRTKAELEPLAAENQKAQKDLDALYNRIFAGQTPDFPDEDQQEGLTQTASQEYQRLEGMVRAEKQVLELLMQEQQAMRVCASQIDNALRHSQMDMFGGGGFSDYMERSALGRADKAASQVYRLHEQARRASPHVKPLPPLQIAQGDLLADVFFDNIFTDMAFHQKIQRSAEELKRAAYQLVQEQNAGEQRLLDLRREMSFAGRKLEQARKQLQTLREGIFERLAEQLPQYSETLPAYSES